MSFSRESASQAEKERFQALHCQRTQTILEMDDASLFTIEDLSFQFPEKARITRSEPCASCGEPTMITRLAKSPHGLLCTACRETMETGSSRNDKPLTFTIRSIGRINTHFKSLDECPHQGVQTGAEGEVLLDEDMLPALKDIEKCTHLILLLFLHQADRSKLQTRPPYGPEIRGTFATRSPHRPNPIALNVVELLGIEGNRLRVKGIDCLDGTPLIDIKPYSADLDSFPEAVIGWRKSS
jgi:tRNA-Thr(GGU) m(6)t(6)A37 methyltransferase TsaA